MAGMAPRHNATDRPGARRQSSSDVASLTGRRSRKSAASDRDEAVGAGERDEAAPPAPADNPERAGGGDSRAVVTLSPAVAAATRRMGEQMGGVGTTEVVRRGLILLDLMLSLSDDEELVIRDKKTQQIDRLRFAWDAF